jgi:hypothetical protein
MGYFCIGSVCIELTLEVGTVLIAAVGGLATWLHGRNQRARRRQLERHHQDMLAVHRREASIVDRADQLPAG